MTGWTLEFLAILQLTFKDFILYASCPPAAVMVFVVCHKHQRSSACP